MSSAPGASAWLAFGDAASRFVFANWVLHATCFLLAGLLLSRLPRLRPGFRHAVLTAALLLAAAAPLLRLLPLPVHPLPAIAAGPGHHFVPVLPAFAAKAMPWSGTTEAAGSPLAAFPLGWALLVGWAAVVTVRLSSLGHGAWSVARWSRQSVPADTDRLYKACGYRLADLPVRETDQITMPGVVGLLRPCILLPPGLTSALEPSALRHVLLHEEAHARRYDPLVLFLAELLHGLLFWHPLAGAARRMMESAAEEACDAHVLAHGIGGRDYARTLLAVLESASPTRHVPTCPLGAGRGSLTGRVARILSGTPRSSSVMAGLAGGALLLIGSSSITAQVGEQPRPPRATPRPVARRPARPDPQPVAASAPLRLAVTGPVRARFLRTVLPLHGRPGPDQILPAGPELALVRGSVPRKGRCIVFALDVSEAAQPYFDQERRAVLEEVEGLGPDDRFNVIAFAAEAGRFAETPVAPSEDSRAGLRAWIDNLSTAPGSDLGGALNLAVSMPDVTTVVLLSDGQAMRSIPSDEALALLGRSQDRATAQAGQTPTEAASGQQARKSAAPQDAPDARREPSPNDPE